MADGENRWAARAYVPPARPTGKQLPKYTALSTAGRQQQQQQRMMLAAMTFQHEQASLEARIPRRSRARHLNPSKRKDWSDPLLGGETHEKERWYEQRSMSRSMSGVPRAVPGDISHLDVSRPLTCLSQTLKGAKVLGSETPFFGSKIAPGPPVWGSVPKSMPLALQAKLAASGNWPIPDTPRCAAVHLADVAAKEEAEAKRKKLADMEAHYQQKIAMRKSMIAVMATTGIAAAPPEGLAAAAEAGRAQEALEEAEEAALDAKDVAEQESEQESSAVESDAASPKRTAPARAARGRFTRT